MKLVIAAGLALLATTTAWAAALTADQQRAIETRTLLDAVEEHCALRVRDTSIFRIIDANMYGGDNRTHDDNIAVAAAKMKAADFINGRARKNPLRFCKEAVEAFGPEGLIRRGVFEPK